LSEPFAYLPGETPEHPGPLGRFLPPIPEGVGAAWLRQQLPAGAWALEPFGAAPRLTIEAARAGYRVLAAVNNPIARFLLELHAAPPAESELRTALADLAVSQKSGERLEPLLRALYRSECAECQQPVEVQAFIWERQAAKPSGILYHCPHCKANYERPASAQDAARAGRFAAGELHRARALERVTPLDDPDRAYAEEALEMYLPRSLYALVTLVNKLESFPPERRRNLAALFLAAFDQTNVLWSHPPARLRPRQLTTPPRFLEKNAWLALEGAIESWATSLSGAGSSSREPIPVTLWPNLPPESGGICIFEGRLKDLADQIRQKDQSGLVIGAALSALPRPNQAYWTLSALWAGWLWGHAANASFKNVLHRRRYDWEWHTEALYAGLRSLAALLQAQTPTLALIGETEAGFLSAALLSAELAGFDLQDMALRAEEGQAQLVWKRGDPDSDERRLPAGARAQNLPAAIQAAARDYLRRQGEPAGYLHLQAAALSGLAQSHRMLATDNPEASAAERFKLLGAALEQAFIQPNAFSRYGGSSRSLDVGLWWLPEGGAKLRSDLASEADAPLADRVEMEVVRYLQKNPASTLEQVDQALCAQFTGLYTPSRELIQECLASYGESPVPGSQGWQLRPEDAPAARRADLESMKNLLEHTGRRLGFQVEAAETISGRTVFLWLEANGEAAGVFYVIATAMLGSVVFAPQSIAPLAHIVDPAARRMIILPGGRARLVEYKLGRDPRLRSALQEGWRLIKFRHLRRLADDLSLERENLERLLDLDPLANRDPQLPLL
jgi:hypothetical protein